MSLFTYDGLLLWKKYYVFKSSFNPYLYAIQKEFSSSYTKRLIYIVYFDSNMIIFQQFSNLVEFVLQNFFESFYICYEIKDY